MDKSVVYEYGHRGLGRPVNRDSRSDGKGINSANNANNGKSGHSKAMTKSDGSKLLAISDNAGNNLEREKERRNKELRKSIVKDANGKTADLKKSSIIKKDFTIPVPRCPLPPSFDMEIDDDCLSTITVATGSGSTSMSSSQSTSNSLNKTSSKEKALNQAKSSSKSGDNISAKVDIKKEVVSNACEDKKLKTLSDTNAKDSKTRQIEKPMDLFRLAFQNKDTDFKNKLAETFKSFMQQRNKSVSTSADSFPKSKSSADPEQKKDNETAKSPRKEKIADSGSSSGNRKETNLASASATSKPVSKSSSSGGKSTNEIKKDEKYESGKARSHRRPESVSKDEIKKELSSKYPILRVVVTKEEFKREPSNKSPVVRDSVSKDETKKESKNPVATEIKRESSSKGLSVRDSSSKEESKKESAKSATVKDSTSKEEAKKDSSKSPTVRDSSSHRLRHNSNRSHVSKPSKDKQSRDPENRKRRAESPAHSKPSKRDKSESGDRSRDKSKKSADSKSRKSKRDLKEISRIQKSLFDSDNEDDESVVKGSRGAKSDKNKSILKSSPSSSKSNKSGKRSHSAAEPQEVVILSSDFSDSSSDESRHAKRKENYPRLKRKTDSNKSRHAAGLPSADKESNSELRKKELRKKESIKNSRTTTEPHTNISESGSASEVLSKSSSLNHQVTTSSPKLPTADNVGKTTKPKQNDSTDLFKCSLSEISSGSLDVSEKSKRLSSDNSKSQHVIIDTAPITERDKEISQTKPDIPSASELPVNAQTFSNNNKIEIELKEDFPVGTDIFDGEVDIENLEATLQPFPQGFACSSSEDLAAIMNMSDYEESDENELGKYAKSPENTLNSMSLLNDDVLSSMTLLNRENHFGSGSSAGRSQLNNNPISLEDMEMQQDFPVLSIPDPRPAPVDDGDESEEEVPLIRIRTDLFSEPSESASSSGISPTRLPDKHSLVPVVDNQTQKTSIIVQEVKKVIKDVLTMGAVFQQKFNSTLVTLQNHSDALTINNLDSEMKTSESSLEAFKNLLKWGSEQLEDKLALHSKTLAVHKDDFAMERMQMDKATNYFGVLVLADTILSDAMYTSFSAELLSVRQRILSILKYYFKSQISDVLQGEAWYFYVSSNVQAKVTTSKYDTWHSAADNAWASLKHFDEYISNYKPVYDHKVLGCDGFKDILENIVIKGRNGRQDVNSDTEGIREIVNTIFSTSSGNASVTPAQANVVPYEPTGLGTASSYLNNCSLVYSPVSVSPISPPNITNYGGATSVATSSAPMVFRETTANNVSISSYTPSTMTGGTNIQQQSLSRPASVHYRETPTQNFNVANTYDNGSTSSYSECMPVGNNCNITIVNNNSSQQSSVQAGNNYYSTSPQVYAMNSNEYMYSQQQILNRSIPPQIQQQQQQTVNRANATHIQQQLMANRPHTPQMQQQQQMVNRANTQIQQHVVTMNRPGTPQMVQRHYPVIGHQDNVTYTANSVSLVRPNQQPVRIQPRPSSHGVVPQGGNQFQGQTQNPAYHPSNNERFQPSYNAIHALSSITGNQGPHYTQGNVNLSMQPQCGQQICYKISSPPPVPQMISANEGHPHYQNDINAICQETKSQMMQQQTTLVGHAQGSSSPHMHHGVSRSISMPVQNIDHSSPMTLDRRSSFESFPSPAGTVPHQNNVMNDCYYNQQ